MATTTQTPITPAQESELLALAEQYGTLHEIRIALALRLSFENAATTIASLRAAVERGERVSFPGYGGR